MISNQKYLCCDHLTYSSSNSDITFGDVDVKLSFNNKIEYFTMKLLDSDYIIIGALEGNENINMKFLILNSDNSNNEKEFEFDVNIEEDNNYKIYIKDFTIIPQGMYLIGYNSFTKYFYELTIPKEEYLYCNSSNITVKENIKINLGDIVPTEYQNIIIKLVKNTCSNLKFGRNNANSGNKGKFNEFTIIPNSPCNITFGIQNSRFGNFNSICYIYFNLCYKNCETCQEYSTKDNL